MAHKHHHPSDDDVSEAQMQAVGIIPGADLLLPLLLKAIKKHGLPLVAAAFAKAIFKDALGTKAKAQAVNDGDEVFGAEFHALGTNGRLSVIKVSNRGPEPTP
jgi:hypothetical protein